MQHIHNYERLVRDGVTYLVSGGGGAKPYEVERTPADLYQSRDFPNYHYVGALNCCPNAGDVQAEDGRSRSSSARRRYSELTLPP